MGTMPMRVVALALFCSSAVSQDAKPEELADALTKGEWTMTIDLAPRFGGEAIAAFHDRPGKIVFEVTDGKITGEYSYSPAVGRVRATLTGEVKDDKLVVKFTEKSLIPSKGFGEFEVKRDKTGKVIALEGWWRLRDIDPALKWHVIRKDDAPKELPADPVVTAVFDGTEWDLTLEIPAEMIRAMAIADERDEVEKEIGDRKVVPLPGSLKFFKKGDEFRMLQKHPGQPPAERVVANLEVADKIATFKARHNTWTERVAHEDTTWTLTFEVKDGKAISAKGRLKNSALDVDLSLSPPKKAEEVKKDEKK